VKTTNAQGGAFTVELNNFADIAPEDFARTRGSTVRRNFSTWDNMPMLGVHRVSDVSLPATMDWKAQGMLSQVKNQGQCGACWAFSSTGSIEAAWAIATKGKQVLALSEQQLVDCDPLDLGCSGGLPERTFTYLERAPMCTAGTYKYTSGETKTAGKCQKDNCMVAIVQGGIIGFTVVTSANVGFSLDSLMSAVAQQPVTASIAGGDVHFQLYSGGVLHDIPGKTPCSDDTDHSVLLVGYGKQDGLDYWLIKNSWGSDWGEKGYAKVLRGKPNSTMGECGIRSDSAYPTVDSSKANPWMNGLPLGTIIIAVLGGIIFVIGLICGCRKCIQKRRLTQQGTSTATSARATAARPAAVTPIAVQALQSAPVPDPNVRRGNSGASRLLG